MESEHRQTWKECQEIERRGRAMLEKHIHRRFPNSEIIRVYGETPQRTYGDEWVKPYAYGSGRQSIEIKCERRNPSGCLFAETHSNRPKDGSTLYARKGWLYTLQCDWLFYFFIQEREGYEIRFKDFQEHCIREISLGRYREVEQHKYQQKNTTVGRLVPTRELVSKGLAVSFRLDCNGDEIDERIELNTKENSIKNKTYQPSLFSDGGSNTDRY